MRKLVSSFLSLALLLAIGCSSGPSPDKVVKDFFDAVIKADFETAAKLAGGANIEKDVLKIAKNEQGERLAKSILARITYEVDGKKIEGSKAEVSVKVTAPDLLRITSKAMSELLPMAFAMAFSKDQSQEKTDALFQQYFENAINDPNAPMTTSNVKIALEKKDGSWVVKPGDELLNALTGNVAKAFSELEKSVTSSNPASPVSNNISPATRFKTVKIGELVAEPDWCEFTVTKVEFTKTVKPPRPASFYSYYQVKNKDTTYLHVIMNVKNLQAADVEADDIIDVKAKYNDKYEYRGFSAMEEDGGSDFTSIGYIRPLTTAVIHFMLEVPSQIETETTPLKLIITANGNAYECVLR